MHVVLLVLENNLYFISVSFKCNFLLDFPQKNIAGFTASLNRRVAWVGGDLGDHPVPPPCYGQAHLSLDQVAWSSIQPGFKHSGMRNLHLVWATCSSFTTLTVKDFFPIPNLNLCLV